MPAGRSSWLRPRNLALLIHTAVVVLAVRAALWLLPWPRVRSMVGPAHKRPSRFSVHRIERAVRVASRMVPCATCLTQALALNHLLSRDGHASTVQIGVRQDAGEFAAHAWVEWVGGPLLSSATEVSRYVRCLTWPSRVT
jgi:hypothetical protein